MTDREGEVCIKRIYEPAVTEDGARVLVDRLWPRGVSKRTAKLALWLKEIAPTPELRKWFDHDPARFEAFSKRYCSELDASDKPVDDLLNMMKLGRVTLLYAAHDVVNNHAVVLAQYLRDRSPDRSMDRLPRLRSSEHLQHGSDN